AHDQDCPCCRLGRNAGVRAMKSMQRIESLLLNAQSQAPATKSERPESHGREGIRRVAFREAAAEVIEALEPIIPPGVRITLGVARDIVVRANPIDVFRIVLNLLRNAIDVAVQTRGELHVRIAGEMAGGKTTVKISDNGPGLPALVQHQFRMPVKAPQKGSH